MDLPKRKPNRLKGYDYSQNGAYFITVCAKAKQNLFWADVGANIVRPQTIPPLSNAGKAIARAVNNISAHYPDVTVDQYTIMPNHIHMILLLSAEGRRTMCAPTISRIIKQMKGYTTKQIGFSPFQRSFYDRVIRNETEYLEILRYINENPLKWSGDQQSG